MEPRTTQRPGGAATTTRYRAVQEDTAVTCVDWQPSHAWTENDTDFTGRVTILGTDPATPVATAGWDTPTDQAADLAVERVGWHRTGPWDTDPLGRRTAPVARERHPHHQSRTPPDTERRPRPGAAHT